MKLLNREKQWSQHIAPPGNFAATFYAPSADVVLNGNPDLTGAIVCKTFYGNGNTSWHYDRALDTEGGRGRLPHRQLRGRHPLEPKSGPHLSEELSRPTG